MPIEGFVILTNKIFCFTSFFFEVTDKINLYLQKKELKSSGAIRLVLTLWFWVITPIAFGCVSRKVDSQSFRNFWDIVISVAWLVDFVYLYGYPMATSLRYFLSYATIFSLFIFMIIIQIMQCYIVPIHSVLKVANMDFLFFCLLVILATLIWSFISCCANIEVSEAGNAILSVITFIIKDFLTEIHEMNIFSDISYSQIIATLGLTNTNYSMMKLSLCVCNFILVIATLVCIIKKYWHKKYKYM